MILDRMQPAYAHDVKAAVVDWSWLRFPGTWVDAQVLHQNLLRHNRWVSLQNVIAIEFRNGETELAGHQFDIEIVGADEKIRTMESHAEPDSEQTRRNHADPGREVSMMNVDVLGVRILEHLGEVGSQPRVCQRANPAT